MRAYADYQGDIIYEEEKNEEIESFSSADTSTAGLTQQATFDTLSSNDEQNVFRRRNKSAEPTKNLVFGEDEQTSLHSLISKAQGESDPAWESVLRYMSLLGEKAKNAVETGQGCHEATFPLHMACRRKPPVEVVRALLQASPKMIAKTDVHEDYSEYLPLHCASAYRASRGVLEELVKNYFKVEGNNNDKTAQTLDGNTPLHLACSYRHFHDNASDPANIELLANTQVLKTLDERGCTPMDKFMRTVGLLDLSEDDRFRAVVDSMVFLVENTPPGLGEYFQSFQLAPAKLLDKAVMVPSVQIFLNEQMKTQFATLVMIGHIYLQTSLVVLFTLLAVSLSDPHIGLVWGVRVVNIIMIICEIAQFSTDPLLWTHDPWNLMDALQAVMVFVCVLLMQMVDHADKKPSIRAFIMVTSGLVWMMELFQLRSAYREFSVFVSGLIHIIYSLVPFLITTFLVLGTFAQMYFTATRGTDLCNHSDEDVDSPFCSFSESLLKVYTMLVSGMDDSVFYNGGVSSDDDESHRDSDILVVSIVFGLFVVILLLNILIAVVSDSWQHVQDEGNRVFWSTRFRFLAEVEMAHIQQRFVCCGYDIPSHGISSAKFQAFLDLVRITYANHQDGSVIWEETRIIKELNIQPCCSNKFKTKRRQDFNEHTMLVTRRVVFVLVIPIWFVLGLCTCGWFWPEQVREYLFCESVMETEEPPAITREDINEAKEEMQMFVLNEVGARLKAIEETMQEMQSLITPLRASKINNYEANESQSETSGEEHHISNSNGSKMQKRAQQGDRSSKRPQQGARSSRKRGHISYVRLRRHRRLPETKKKNVAMDAVMAKMCPQDSSNS